MLTCLFVPPAFAFAMQSAIPITDITGLSKDFESVKGSFSTAG